MLRKMLSVVLTLLTIIGGHFINRRWDRAIFILGLLILWGVLCYGYLIFNFNSFTDPEDLLSFYKTIWKVFMYGAFFIWALSLLLNIYDIRQSKGNVIGGIGGNLGATVVSVMAMVIAISLILGVLSNNLHWRTKMSGSLSSYNISYFSEYLGFGGRFRPQDELLDLPDGKARINGVIKYESKPVAGVTFRFVINDKYTSKKIVSDSEGHFSFSLPEGEWFINSIEIGGWPDRPEGRYSVLSGYEPVLKGDSYDKYIFMGKDGLKVKATINNTERAFDFTIKPNIEIVWPPEIPYYDRKTKSNNASLEKDSIEWKPVKAATQYLVKLSKITRSSDSSVSSSSIIDYKVTKPKLALSELKSMPGSAGNSEYGVEVYAFDKNGKLLSMADTGISENTFVLTDGNELVKDSIVSMLGEDVSNQNIQQLIDNQKRFDAARTLVDEDLVIEAEKLLTKVKGKSRPGEKELILGLVAAKKGDCDGANLLFEEAKSQSGRSCVPQKYLDLCK